MKYIQFYTLSTGYVEGTVPPEFDEALVKPVEGVGSDSVLILDGRLNYAHCKLEADYEMQSPRRHRYCGYQLMQGDKISTAKPWGDYVPRPE